jgi:hypothetical protein
LRQAEQLQASIAYFRIDERAAATGARTAPGRRAPSQSAAPVADAEVTPRPNYAKPHPAKKTGNGKLAALKNGHAKGKAGNGFALDLSTGADARDAEFKQY